MAETQKSTSETQKVSDSTKTRRQATASANESVSMTQRDNEKKQSPTEANEATTTSSILENSASELQNHQPQIHDQPLPKSGQDTTISVGSENVATVPVAKDQGDVPVTMEASESYSEKEADDGKPSVVLTPEGIADFAREQGVRCFRNQHGSFYVRVPVIDGESTHFECHPLRSKAFLALILALIRVRTESSPKLRDVKKAIEIMELEAYRSPKINLENRTAMEGDEIIIDLGDPKWSMIRVDQKRWSVEVQDQARFFRPDHLRSLPNPERGGHMDDLFKFIPSENSGERLLMTAWLLGALHAGVPNPMLVFVGQQGSAKTTRTRRLRSLLDPSVTPVLGDMEMSNLFLTFQHHAVPCFENVSQFNRREADMFCRAVTGNGVERRKLYTDSDQVLYSFRRSIIINGIDTPSMRPDFLDRCLIVNCRRMDKFQPLHELDRQFEESRPRILGAMLDVLVKTLRVLPSTPTAEEFRMADFAHFGRAVAIARGQQPSDFDKAYRLNIRHRNFEVLEDAPMVQLLKEFSLKHPAADPWIGSAVSLLDKLQTIATNKGDANGMKDLPKSGRCLSIRLGEMTSALKTTKIIVEKLQRTNDLRGWKVFAE